MEKNGSMGKWMMRNTASIQVSFDAISERDIEEMVFVADCLHPIAAYLFANSPYQNRNATESKNIRNIIWENTDQNRCRSLFDHGIGIPKGLVSVKSIISSPADWIASFSANPETKSSLLVFLTANLAPELDPIIVSPLLKLEDIPDISNVLLTASHSLTLAVAPEV